MQVSFKIGCIDVGDGCWWTSQLESPTSLWQNLIEESETKNLRTQRKTWTTNLITLNSIFAISYLLTMAPIDIWVLVSIDWKQAAFVCKFGMFWVYVCSG